MNTIDKFADNVAFATILMVMFAVGELLIVGWFFTIVGETFTIDATLAAGTIIFNYVLSAIVMIGEAIKHHE